MGHPTGMRVTQQPSHQGARRWTSAVRETQTPRPSSSGHARLREASARGQPRHPGGPGTSNKDDLHQRPEWAGPEVNSSPIADRAIEIRCLSLQPLKNSSLKSWQSST